MVEKTGELIRRRRWDRHADNRKKLREIAAFEREIEFLTFEMQRIEQLAVDARLGRAEVRTRIDRIRIVRIAQAQQRAAARMHAALQAFETAFAVDFELRTLIGRLTV